MWLGEGADYLPAVETLSKAADTCWHSEAFLGHFKVFCAICWCHFGSLCSFAEGVVQLPDASENFRRVTDDMETLDS